LQHVLDRAGFLVWSVGVESGVKFGVYFWRDDIAGTLLILRCTTIARSLLCYKICSCFRPLLIVMVVFSWTLFCSPWH